MVSEAQGLNIWCR